MLTQNLLEVEEGLISQLLLFGQNSTKLHLLFSIGLQKYVYVQHICKALPRVLLLLDPYSSRTTVSELHYKRSTFSPLVFTNASTISKILVRSKDFLLLGSFEKKLILYSAKTANNIPIFCMSIFRIILCRTCC